jgi:hypothetical protein
LRQGITTETRTPGSVAEVTICGTRGASVELM